MGPYGPLLFVVAVASAELIPLFPTQPLSLASGLLFGPRLVCSLPMPRASLLKPAFSGLLFMGPGEPILYALDCVLSLNARRLSVVCFWAMSSCSALCFDNTQFFYELSQIDIGVSPQGVLLALLTLCVCPRLNRAQRSY